MSRRSSAEEVYRWANEWDDRAREISERARTAPWYTRWRHRLDARSCRYIAARLRDDAAALAAEGK